MLGALLEETECMPMDSAISVLEETVKNPKLLELDKKAIAAGRDYVDTKIEVGAVSQPGAAASELETQIAQKVEGSIASIGNVRNITTWIIEGEVNMGVEFEIGTPIDRAVTDVRDAVSKVRNDLPQGILEPIIERVNVDGDAIADYAVTTTARTP